MCGQGPREMIFKTESQNRSRQKSNNRKPKSKIQKVKDLQKLWQENSVK